MPKKKIKVKSIPKVIAREIRSGVPKEQAVAITFSKAGKSKKKRKKKK